RDRARVSNRQRLRVGSGRGRWDRGGRRRSGPRSVARRPVMVQWKRALRSPSSERFLAQKDGKDAAAVDLHYPDGTVAGTVLILEGCGLDESNIPELLHSLDDEFLPGVDLGSGSLTFTVVIGKVLGNYEATDEPGTGLPPRA